MNEIPVSDLDVVVSSRVRLARNYEDIPFAPRIDDAGAEEVIKRALSACESAKQSENFALLRMRELSPSAQKRLVDRHLISYDLIKYQDRAAALIAGDETLSVMLNEEDHLRIQGLLPGLQLEKAAELAFRADDLISREGCYAFDAQWGYLTSCPTNTGTGLRASTLLHLPTLCATGQIGQLIQALAKLGLTVRGLYGEGSNAVGGLYQISNQVTLGRTEEDILRTLIAATNQIAGHERAAREQALNNDRLLVEDKLMRSLGLCKNARILSAKEFMERYDDLRVAAALGLIGLSVAETDRLMMDLQDASVCASAGAELDERGRDALRAETLRERLKNA